MSAPYSYEFINAVTGSFEPSTVHCRNNNLTWFFKRYLLQRIFSVFKWTLPETWSMDYFRYVLYMAGYICICNTDAYGAIPQMAGLRGYNVFYQPTHAIITNPKINGILEPEIDSQCVIIKLTPDYCGVMDLVSYYADLMALAGEAESMNLVNSKLAFLLGARNKAMAEALKKLYDQIASGNPMVVYDKDYRPEDNKPLLEFFNQNLKENFIAPDIQLSIRKLENEFDAKIGLANVNSEKKERLTNEEVNANRDETYSLGELWLASLKEGVDKAKAMFGLDNFSVDWRVCHDDGSNSVSSGTLDMG